jgi:hypothetical protein
MATIIVLGFLPLSIDAEESQESVVQASEDASTGKWSYDSNRDLKSNPVGSGGNVEATNHQGSASGSPLNQTRKSEFDNSSDEYVKDWRVAPSSADYRDTEFGELMYNESSVPTRLELLRLISKETPSVMVFLKAVSMGLDIETVLQAAVRYEPEKSRDFAASAVNILPVISESASYRFADYELKDLPRDDPSKPYLVEDVIKRFFDDRSVLRPFPDWYEGQYHFLASAAELKRLQQPNGNVRWYKTKSFEPVENRPIFVSLYEADQSVLIDGENRINQALANDPNALLPVVFVYNRLNERSIDQLGYPETIKGVQTAYSEKRWMVTPAPEWEMGEYHIYSPIEDFYEIFNIPDEQDFEPEAWQKLLKEAEDYTVTNTSFVLVIVGSPDENNDSRASITSLPSVQYAAWDDPRTERAFPYTAPMNDSPVTLDNLIGQGIFMSRPDLIAALNALGVTHVPVAFYYVDRNRVPPYRKDPKALIAAAIGAGSPVGPLGITGGTPPPPTVCASPPCTEQE